MKQSLYMLNCYMQEFNAVIENIIDERLIILNHTAFYPTGGGQPFDTGKFITEKGEEYKVINVSKSQENIIHEVDIAGLKKGQHIHGIINWERRYKHMRMHTAAHVLANIIEIRSKALISGNQLNTDKSRIDFNLEDFNRDDFYLYETEANKLIKENRKVNWYLLSREEAIAKASRLTTLAKGFPAHIQEVRLVEIEGLVIEACGGTHLKNIGEIGQIKITQIDNKGKNNRRIYFELKD